MKTKVEKHDDIAVVSPKGSLIGGPETMDLQATIRELIDAGNRKLIVDLGKVELMTSRPIGVLVEALVNYNRRSGRIVLCNVDKKIRNVFVITQLVKVFAITETLPGALEMLKGS